MSRQGSLLRLGCRSSALAMYQGRMVATALQASWQGLRVRVRGRKTSGDNIEQHSLRAFGGKGLFVKELDTALIEGEIDCAVHSLKDVPCRLPGQVRIGAVLARADPRDVWICPFGFSLRSLPAGFRVGTSSLRRQALVLASRPDLRVVEIRGNLPRRLQRLRDREIDAIILATAGVQRLKEVSGVTGIEGMMDLEGVTGVGSPARTEAGGEGIGGVVCRPLPEEDFLPAIGQGVIAVLCRESDLGTQSLLRPISDPATTLCVCAERQVARTLGASCLTPIAALARIDRTHLHLRALLSDPSGKRMVMRRGKVGMEIATSLPEAGKANMRAAIMWAKSLGSNIGRTIWSAAGVDLRTQAGLSSTELSPTELSPTELPQAEVPREPLPGRGSLC